MRTASRTVVLAAVILGAGLMSDARAQEAQERPAPPRERVDEDVIWKIRREAIEHSQIMRTLHVLADVHGPRLTGSPNLRAAQDWVVQQATAWGLKNAHLEEWDFGHPGWLNEQHVGAPGRAGEGLAGRRSARVDAGHDRDGHRLDGADRPRRPIPRRRISTRSSSGSVAASRAAP